MTQPEGLGEAQASKHDLPQAVGIGPGLPVQIDGDPAAGWRW
ncbi:hypothetical protein [Dactylosporangium sp. CA-092794]